MMASYAQRASDGRAGASEGTKTRSDAPAERKPEMIFSQRASRRMAVESGV
jgi:hypothetical protein